MRLRYLTLLFMTVRALGAFATGDSLQFLTPKDTVFLEVDGLGNKVFMHQLEKGQTLYSMARFYGLKLDAIKAFNPQLDMEGPIAPGQVVKVPIPDSAVVKYSDSVRLGEQYVPVVYSVKPGDTFYHIAKTCFRMSLDTLYRRNGMTSFILHEGQKLLIGWLDMAGIPDSLQMNNGSPLGARMRQLSFAFEAGKTKHDPHTHSGAAYWQREKKGMSDFYALHRLAPAGSIIQITNPMKNRVAYAMVIGKIPDRAYGDDTIVVLSPSIAKLLGAKDPRFYVEVQYFR